MKELLQPIADFIEVYDTIGEHERTDAMHDKAVSALADLRAAIEAEDGMSILREHGEQMLRECAPAKAEGEPVAYAENNDLRQAKEIAERWGRLDGMIDSGNLYWALGVALRYASPPTAAPEATQYIALCDAMGYNERTDSLTSPEEHAQSLVAEIKRLKQRAVPMTEEEILVRFDEIVNARAHDSKVILFARLIEARKARPMTDEEMILRGWRRCAVGQRTTQYCGQVEKAVAAEREACAKVLDDWKKHNWTFEDCAAVVRARGEK